MAPSPAFCFQPPSSSRYALQQVINRTKMQIVASGKHQNGVLSSFHELASGQKMEVLQCTSAKIPGKRAPIVFIHGSYHAAWCWAVHWIPFFSQAGYKCFALSLLGQGQSDAPLDQRPQSLEIHARDIGHFVKTLDAPPILIGHSFGGLVVQNYLSLSCVSRACSPVPDEHELPSLQRAVLACSVPPTGNKDVVMRYLRSKPWTSIKVTYSLAGKGFTRSLGLCRETFFSPDMSDAEVQRFQGLMKSSSAVPLFDLKKLNASLPIACPVGDVPPVLVVGAEHDFILDKEAIEETATFYKTEPVIVPNIAHDIMLDTNWKEAAKVVSSWLNVECSNPC